MNNLIMYTDGGSRGNPGKAAIGVAIYNASGAMIKKYGQYLGDPFTNNEAEYHAVISGLKTLLAMPEFDSKEIVLEVRSDSQLLVNQVSGTFKIKQEHIRAFVVTIHKLIEQFGAVKFISIPREQNKVADALVNESLDAQG
jgi:ribonuclease HI